MLIEESILASGVLSVGRTLLEQLAVIFLAPAGAYKQTHIETLRHPSYTCPGGGCELPREASSQPESSQRCLLLLQNLH